MAVSESTVTLLLLLRLRNLCSEFEATGISLCNRDATVSDNHTHDDEEDMLLGLSVCY